MWRLKIILKSMSKQGMKFKLVFFQLVLIFIALNFAFTLVNKNLDLKDRINNFIDKDKSIMLKFSISPKDKNLANSVNQIYDEIAENEVVDKIGSFDIETIKLKEKKSNLIYLDKGAFKLYNLKVCKGTGNIFEYERVEDEIPIIVSNDLSGRVELNEIINMEVLKNNKLEKVKFKVIGITDGDALFWNTKNGGQASLNKIKNSIIMPLDKDYYYDEEINCSMKTSHTIVSVKKSENLKQFESDFKSMNNRISRDEYIEVNDLIAMVYEQSKPWIMLSLCFATLLTSLSIIGFVGILTNYITFRKREYGIRFALGSTRKELARLVGGEIVVAVVITNLISILPIIILTYLFDMDFRISFIVKSMFPTLIVSIILLIMTFVAYDKVILKKNIVDLIRGN